MDPNKYHDHLSVYLILRSIMLFYHLIIIYWYFNLIFSFIFIIKINLFLFLELLFSL